MQRQQLEGLSREELVERAERLGVPRPRVLTHPELMDEILARSMKSGRDRARARGWVGRARDLIAGVIERGLHLPDVAKALRSTPSDKTWPEPPPPLPTITLAEIYAAQGHLDRAIGVLDDVLAREPEHVEAGALRARFATQASRPKSVRPVRAGDTPHPGRAGDTPQPGARHAAAHHAAGPAQPKRAAPALAVPPPAANHTAATSSADASGSGTPHTPISVETAHTPGRHESVPPLPERYDVDEVVAIAVDPTTIYVYWEVRPTTMARARARRPEGQLALRVVSVTPSWDGPLAQTRDLRIDPLFGDLFVRDLPPGANVRVSVGWLSSTRAAAGSNAHEVAVVADGDFEPFAVGLEINAPRAMPTETAARGVAVWSATPSAAPRAAATTPRAGTPAVTARALRRMEASAPHAGASGAASAAGETAGGQPRTSAQPLPAARRSWLVQRGGSSEMYLQEEVSGGWVGRRWGGASELGRGGASEQTRAGSSEPRPGGSSDLRRG